jgi:putative ABC transport system permease protein
VERGLAEKARISGGLRVVPFEDNLTALNDAFDAAFAGTYALLLVAFCVTFVGVLNFSFTNVLDRAAWYGVLRGLGFDSTELLKVALSESVGLGVVGGCLGLLAGVLAGWITLAFSIPLVSGWFFPYQLPVGALTVAFVGTIALCALAGGLPGVRVARGEDVRGPTHHA